MKTSTRYDLEQKKVLVSASLFSIVLVATLANRTLLSHSIAPSASSQNESRGLASVDNELITKPQTLIIQELSKSTERQPASLGRTPTAEEKLRFGLLEGKYMIRFSKGKITQIQFHDDMQSGVPKYVESPKSFLESHRDLLAVPFEHAVLNDKKIYPTKVLEIYDLVQTNKPVGQVQFELDIYGRLLSMILLDEPIIKNGH